MKKNRGFSKHLSRGFTMIELMITITILGTLTVMTAQAISQAIKAKIKLQDQIDDASRIRDAIRLIERDINLAYHYRDIEKELEQLIKKKNKPAAGAVPVTDNSNNPPAREEVQRQNPETNFVGSNESIQFVTFNNGRTVRNAHQADFVEVGYSLKDCRSLREDKGSSKCLWRRSSPYVDLDVTKGGDEVALLENVSEFKLRYIGKGKQDWVSDWRTDEQGDGATKGKFPQAVEVSLTVEKKNKGKGKKYSMQVIVPIHFPNNPEEAANAQTNPGNQSTQGTQDTSSPSQ